jgi:hypothetical protein
MTEFRTDAIFKTLKSLLAVIDNEERRNQIESYIDAAQAPLERAVFDVLSQFAEAVDEQTGGQYKVNLAYRPGVLDLEVRRAEQSEQQDEDWSSMPEGEVEKITLRIPSELKELATEAAARSGLSVNAWFVRMLARSVRSAEPAEPPDIGPGFGPPRGRHGRHGRHGPGQRLSGWVGPE